MGIFLVIMLKLNDHYSKRRIILLLLVALSSVAVDFARMPITSSSVGVVADMEVAHNYGVGITQFFARWNNLINSVHIYFGGIFANFLILILGIYWLLRSDLREPPNIFLVVFLSLGIIPVFFGTWTVQTRVFYEIPFQIPSAIALTWIMKQPWGTVVCIPFCIWLIAISVINVANF
jgi:hypothetical protein